MAASKPLCKYGAACYRKNKDHLRKFFHPPPASDSSSPPPAKKQRKELSTLTPPPSSTNPSTTDHSTASTRQDTSAQASPSSEHESPGGQTSAKDKSLSPSPIAEEEEEEGEDAKDSVLKKFLVQMPEDFYQFWEFCTTLNPSAPQCALRSSLGLELVGPYHVLSGQLRGVAWQRCVLHCRHYHDPPEMVTVLAREGESGYHVGYFRDDPKDVSGCLLVANSVSDGFELKPLARNIFDAVRLEVVAKLEKDPKLSAVEKKALEQLRSSLLSEAKRLGLKFTDPKSIAKERGRVVLAKCLHKMGLVVPYDAATELGYRSLPMSDRELLRLLNKISNCSDEAERDRKSEPLQEIITFVQFANDECDYGMGLELGLDLFSHGAECFHGTVGHLLPLAYDLLQRTEFGRIVSEHLKNRSKKPLDFRRTK